MFEDLGKIINAIEVFYKEICEKWALKQLSQEKVNFKKKCICDIEKNENIMNTILEYRSFINNEAIVLECRFDELGIESDVSSRVKAQNSIEFKIDNYIKNHESGKVPINKCLNDLYGIRIILDSVFTHEQVLEYIEKEFPKYKCIDSSKNSYKATHIYFKNGNFDFQWELQIWQKKDAMANFESHKIYKQDYTKWENDSKGSD